MNEGTLAKPQAGVAKMQEVSGNTGQVGGDSRPLEGGVYRHPQSGQEIIALTDPITGDAQARGYVRAGFQWVRDVKEGEVTSVGLNPSEDFAKQPERKVEAESDEIRSLRARLASLEAAEDRRKEDEDKTKTATELSQERAQEAAEQKIEERGTDNSGDVAVSGGVNTAVTPLVETESTNESDAEKPKRGRPAKEEGAK